MRKISLYKEVVGVLLKRARENWFPRKMKLKGVARDVGRTRRNWRLGHRGRTTRERLSSLRYAFTSVVNGDILIYGSPSISRHYRSISAWRSQRFLSPSSNSYCHAQRNENNEGTPQEIKEMDGSPPVLRCAASNFLSTKIAIWLIHCILWNAIKINLTLFEKMH